MKKVPIISVLIILLAFVSCSDETTAEKTNVEKTTMLKLSCVVSPIHPDLYNPGLSGGWYLFKPGRGQIIDGHEWEIAGYINLSLETRGVNDHFYFFEINEPYRFGNLRLSDPETNKAHESVFGPGEFEYGKSIPENDAGHYYNHFRISWVVWPANNLIKENIVLQINRPKNFPNLTPPILRVIFYDKKTERHRTIFFKNLSELPGWYPVK